MTVIGLTGLKGCGKDTAAEALVQDGWKRLALADPLRHMLYTLNPIIKFGHPPGSPAFGPGPEYLRWQDWLDHYGYDEAKKDPEVRRLMQVFGTEVIREQFGKNAWVDLAERTIQAEPWTSWVVTDVRFDNEARMIHDLGGHVIQVVRDGLTADGHASEAGVDLNLIDLRLPNNGTVEHLHMQIRSVVNVVGQLRRAVE